MRVDGVENRGEQRCDDGFGGLDSGAVGRREGEEGLDVGDAGKEVDFEGGSGDVLHCG